jgi:hypothetical protein
MKSIWTSSPTNAKKTGIKKRENNKLFHPIIDMREIEFERWLNKKTEHMPYEYHRDILPPHPINPKEHYDYYYSNNDTDEKASDVFYINLLNSIKQSNPRELKRDKHLAMINTYIERYGKKKILINPNTNRYHANHLFKNIIDYVETNFEPIEILNLSNVKIENQFNEQDKIYSKSSTLFTAKDKKKFYKICKLFST